MARSPRASAESRAASSAVGGSVQVEILPQLLLQHRQRPNAELDDKRPKDLLLDGRAEVIADMLEGALAGVTS